MHRRRSPLALALTSTLALSMGALTACGGVGGGSTPGTAASASKGAISGALSTTGFGFSDEVAKSRVQTFQSKYPQVQVKVNEGDFDEQQFLSSVASGSPSDLIYLDREKLGTFAAQGALQPLTQCLKDQDIAMSTYRPTAVQAVTLNDKVYGIPEFNQARVLYLDTEALKSAGIDPASFSTADWDKLAAMSQQATTMTGGKLTRIGFDPKAPEFFPLWVKAAGGDVLSKDGTKAQLDSEQAVKALTFIKQLADVDGGFSNLKTFRDTFDVFGAGNFFVKNQVAVTPFEDWYLNVLAEVSPNVPVQLKAFDDQNGKPITYVTGQAWAIPKGAKNTAAACAFMKTMTAKDTWVAAAKAKKAARDAKSLPFTGLWTANPSADQAIMADVYKPSGTAWLDDGVKLLQGLQDKGFAIPPAPAGAEFKDAWTKAVTSVLDGSANPKDALAGAQKTAQSALDGAKS